MNLSALIGVAAIAGAGIYLGKKYSDTLREKTDEDFRLRNELKRAEKEAIREAKRAEKEARSNHADYDTKYESFTDEDGNVFYTEPKETFGTKVKKASLYAAGVITTGADKIAENAKGFVADVKTGDMVQKGDDALAALTGKVDSLAKSLSDIKDKAFAAKRDIAEGVSDIADDVVEGFSDIKDDVADDVSDVKSDLSQDLSGNDDLSTKP
ncbi:MAG: hypothetical protein LBN42_01850 [Oscillospiraceae bacterium]|jgi:gas vesicle protein|nr:hypothetical protein [Oscillospiraceae bacterium]